MDRSSDPSTPPPPAMFNEVPEPALGLPLDRAGAMLPGDLLQGDETIILLLKPSPWYVVLASLGTLTALAVITIMGLWARRHFGLAYSDETLVALAGILMLVRLAWQFMHWVGRTYVLTDRRLVRIRGVFQISIFQTELHHIQHTDLIFTVRERVFGLGSIAFSTSGSDVPEAYWVTIAHPYTIHRRILQAIHRYRKRH